MKKLGMSVATFLLVALNLLVLLTPLEVQASTALPIPPIPIFIPGTVVSVIPLICQCPGDGSCFCGIVF